MTVRPALSTPLALVLGALCALLVACGGGDGGDADALIPSARADALQRELDRLDRAVRTGDCDAVGGTVSRLQEEVNALPARVDAGLRERLSTGVANLVEIAPEECLEEQQTETTDTTETVVTETTETTDTQAETTETEPVDPVDTTETDPPAETTAPPAETTAPPVETVPPDTGGGAAVPDSGDAGDAGGTGGTGGASPTP